MKLYFSTCFLVLWTTPLLYAQHTMGDKEGKLPNADKMIIIKKNRNKSDKFLISIDSIGITINGIPVDDFKSDRLIITSSSPKLKNEPPSHFKKRTNILPPPPAFGDNEVYPEKPMLGVVLQKSEDDDGVFIKSFAANSAAEKAGLKVGDKIIELDSVKIYTPEDLVNAVQSHSPNQKVTIRYLRKNKENMVTAVLKKYEVSDFPTQPFVIDPSETFRNFGSMLPPSKDSKPRLGLQIEDSENEQGVIIKAVDEDSPAEKAGLKEGDIILNLNNKEVKTVGDVRKETENIKAGATIQINYSRKGLPNTANIKLPNKKAETLDF